MKAYFLSVLTAVLFSAVIGLLSPAGEKNSIGNHSKLLTMLFLTVIMIAPLKDGVVELCESIRGLASSSVPSDVAKQREQLEESISEASKSYFREKLCETLCAEFDISPQHLRCRIEWDEDRVPKRVTVLLSGSAIWKDTGAIEAFVEELLGCACQSAIE